MIVRPRPHWLRMLFVWRGSVLNRILPQLLVTTSLSVVVVVIHGELLQWKVTLTAVPFSLMGVALAVFLGFRISASYERYWEARRLWGQMLTAGRSAARQALTFTRADARPFVLGVAAFAHAVRDQLRGRDGQQELRRLLPEALVNELASSRFPPVRILSWLAQWVRARHESGEMTPILAARMDQSLTVLGDALGGCERIASTPLPFTYSVILHRTVYLYCFMLPFGLLDSIGFMTPLMVAFVAYTFFALEALSDEIEEPFGTLPNDLPLDAMAITIETSLREMLGETELPAAAEAVDFVLT
ncbi:MAG: hypothetical protein KDH15_06055 [Rhodocyclaceae bacterium]|nr:hypothetical protein [Rhodocyclaceae bacterium]